MKNKRSNPDFLNGVPELLILRLLAGRPQYGYELVQAIRSASGEELSFGEGCIYPILHRLEKQKLLAGKRETVNGRSRVVYRVTARGKKQLSESSENYRRIVQAVCRVLQGGEHGDAAVA